LHACSTPPAAYDVVIEAAVDVLGFDWCCLAEATDGMFELVAAADGAPVAVGDRLLAIDEGLAGEAYQTGEPVHADDIQAANGAAPVDDTFRSGLSVPLEGWGVFQSAADERNAFDEVDLQVLELLLAHAAEAFRRIDNEAELRRQNERLEKFTSVVSHDLRSPLSVANGRLELYRETGDTAHLDEAGAAIDRIESRLEALLSLARQGQTVGERETVRVTAAAEDAWRNVVGDGTLSVDCGTTVQADRTRLVQLFENLFRNALEHGSTGVTITVGDTDEGFYVADDGPGIPPGDREDVFELGHTTREDGTGFGLAIVQTIAEAHGWTVTAGESAAGGARFEVRTA
jgi:signal transduction histidine kinase